MEIKQINWQSFAGAMQKNRSVKECIVYSSGYLINWPDHMSLLLFFWWIKTVYHMHTNKFHIICTWKLHIICTPNTFVSYIRQSSFFRINTTSFHFYLPYYLYGFSWDRAQIINILKTQNKLKSTTCPFYMIDSLYILASKRKPFIIILKMSCLKMCLFAMKSYKNSQNDFYIVCDIPRGKRTYWIEATWLSMFLFNCFIIMMKM